MCTCNSTAFTLADLQRLRQVRPRPPMCEFSFVNVFAIEESLGFAFFILGFTAFIYLSIRRVKMAAAQHIINEIEAKEVELLDQIEALKALDVQRNADKLFGAPPVPVRTRWRYESMVGHEVFWILVPSMIFLVIVHVCPSDA